MCYFPPEIPLSLPNKVLAVYVSELNQLDEDVCFLDATEWSLFVFQFVQRVLLVFMPAKYQPDYIYLRHVKTFRVHIFTAIQTVCSIIMWFIKSIAFTSIIFPLMVMRAQ